MIKYTFLLFFILFCSNSAISKTNNVEAELITNVKSIQPGHDFYIALKLSAKPNWHTYWRNPGDSGIPTTIMWELPDGFKYGEIEWPAPHLFSIEGIANYGYDKEEFLLVKITPPKLMNNTESIVIKANAKWLACRVECVPESKSLSITIPVKQTSPELIPKVSKIFDETIEKFPVKSHKIKLSASFGKNSIIISGNMDDINAINLGNIRFFPYESGYFNNSAEQVFKITKNNFSLEVALDDFKIGLPESIKGILFNKSGWDTNINQAIEIDIKVLYK